MEECIICFEETTDFIHFSCTHKVCATCYPKVKVLACPVCETPIQIELDPIQDISCMPYIQACFCVVMITVSLYSILNYGTF